MGQGVKKSHGAVREATANCEEEGCNCHVLVGDTYRKQKECKHGKAHENTRVYISRQSIYTRLNVQTSFRHVSTFPDKCLNLLTIHLNASKRPDKHSIHVSKFTDNRFIRV